MSHPVLELLRRRRATDSRPGHRLDDDRLAVDLARTMHTEQSVTVHAPLAADTDYQAEARIESVRSTAAGRMIAFRTTLRGPDDAVVQELTTTLLTAAPAEQEGEDRG